MFKFKGISSDSMQVIVEEESDFIRRAGIRYETTEVDGKDGAFFDELGYSFLEVPIRLQCLDVKKIDNIFEWLNGSGQFEYKNRITNARFYMELDPQRFASIQVIDTTFIRDPFWNNINDEYLTINETKIIKNEGNIESRPIILLEKKENIDNIDIEINNIRFKYTFLRRKLRRNKL